MQLSKRQDLHPVGSWGLKWAVRNCTSPVCIGSMANHLLDELLYREAATVELYLELCLAADEASWLRRIKGGRDEEYVTLAPGECAIARAIPIQ